MGIEDQINKLESEMFNGLVHAFKYLNYGKSRELTLCLMALDELNSDYMSMTKKSFINANAAKRLSAGLSKLNERGKIVTSRRN